METDPTEVDLGGGTDEETDPFADVPSDVGAETEDDFVPPEGTERGSLGGFDPSEEELAEQEEGPEQGEFMEEPEEAEHPMADDPLAGEQFPGEPTPPEPPEPAVEPEPEPDPEPEPEPEPEPAEEPDLDDEEPGETATAVGGSEADEDADAPPPPEAEAEAPTKPAPPDDGKRYYVPIQSAKGMKSAELTKLAKEGRLWISHDPVEARSGEGATRKVFRTLAGEEGVGSYVLAMVPSKLWQPKPVEGRKLDQVAIKIG